MKKARFRVLFSMAGLGSPYTEHRPHPDRNPAKRVRSGKGGRPRNLRAMPLAVLRGIPGSSDVAVGYEKDGFAFLTDGFEPSESFSPIKGISVPPSDGNHKAGWKC